MAEESLISSAVSSGYFNIGFYVFLVVLVLGIIAWLVWTYIKKKVLYVFNFRIIDSTGNLIKKKARIIRDDKGVRKFEIKDLENHKIDIRDPNWIVDGVPTRVVSWDGMGNLVYVEDVDYENINSNWKFKVAKNTYLQTALLPVEREQVVTAGIDSIKKHGDIPMLAKLAMWFAIALIIAIVVGMFIQGKLLSEQYTQNAKATEVMHENSKALQIAAETIKENTEIQRLVLAQVLNLSGKPYNITFQTK